MWQVQKHSQPFHPIRIRHVGTQSQVGPMHHKRLTSLDDESMRPPFITGQLHILNFDSILITIIQIWPYANPEKYGDQEG